MHKGNFKRIIFPRILVFQNSSMKVKVVTNLICFFAAALETDTQKSKPKHIFILFCHSSKVFFFSKYFIINLNKASFQPKQNFILANKWALTNSDVILLPLNSQDSHWELANITLIPGTLISSVVIHST